MIERGCNRDLVLRKQRTPTPARPRLTDGAKLAESRRTRRSQVSFKHNRVRGQRFIMSSAAIDSHYRPSNLYDGFCRPAAGSSKRIAESRKQLGEREPLLPKLNRARCAYMTPLSNLGVKAQASSERP